MSGMIVYGSIYGTAQAYAEECAKRAGLPVSESKKAGSLKRCGCVVHFGGLYAGEVQGLKKTIKAIGPETRLAIATIGLADVSDAHTAANVRVAVKKELPSAIAERARFFHLRGGIDYTKLSFKHKTMMMLAYNRVQGLPEHERTAEDLAMMETFGQQVSFVDFAGLNPILRWIEECQNA